MPARPITIHPGFSAALPADFDRAADRAERRVALALEHGMHLGREAMAPWVLVALGLGVALGGALGLLIARWPAVVAALGGA